MSSNQSPSLLYTIALIIFTAIASAVVNHFFPQTTKFLGPIIRPKILKMWAYCIDGRRSVRKEWKERGRGENWETITTVEGVWEWDRKSSDQNVRSHGIPFSSLNSFAPMCEANLLFEPRTSYSYAELEKGNIAPELSPGIAIEICGRMGEDICIVSGKKESNVRIIIKSVKRITLDELNQLRKSIPEKHELEYEAIEKSWKKIHDSRQIDALRAILSVKQIRPGPPPDAHCFKCTVDFGRGIPYRMIDTGREDATEI